MPGTGIAAGFALDEREALNWLRNYAEIGAGWSPVHDDEGGAISGLVADATERGVLTRPPGNGTRHYDIGYHYVADADGGGYRWLVYLPGGLTLASAFRSAPSYAGGLPLADNGRTTAITGPRAALAVLREAAKAANSLMDDLASYVAALPPAASAPWAPAPEHRPLRARWQVAPYLAIAVDDSLSLVAFADARQVTISNADDVSAALDDARAFVRTAQALLDERRLPPAARLGPADPESAEALIRRYERQMAAAGWDAGNEW